MDRFHAKHPRLLLQLSVTRVPYSWAGDDTENVSGEKVTYSSMASERTRLGTHEPSNPGAKLTPMDELGRQASIQFDWSDIKMKWHPVDSQRLLLWSSRFGVQELLAGKVLLSPHPLPPALSLPPDLN